MQKPESLETEPDPHIHGADTGDVAARTAEVRDNTAFDRVGPVRKTTGIVAVAALAASVAPLPNAAIIVTPWRSRSLAKSGSRLCSLYAHRYSSVTLRRSTKPNSPSPLWNAPNSSCRGEPPLRYPTTGSVGCCARAASGHVA